MNSAVFMDGVALLVVRTSSTHNHPDDHPGGNHVADVAEDHEYMEDGVDVGNLFETMQYGSGDVCYSFTDTP